jgi:hypothetical protein
MNKTHIDTLTPYDRIDIDNKFIIIYRSNLNFYFKKYNCKSELELEDCLWINYGITIKII